MIDWNGNGKIDPTDIGISIAVANEAENEELNNEVIASERGSLWSKIISWLLK